MDRTVHMWSYESWCCVEYLIRAYGKRDDYHFYAQARTEERQAMGGGRDVYILPFEHVAGIAQRSTFLPRFGPMGPVDQMFWGGMDASGRRHFRNTVRSNKL